MPAKKSISQSAENNEVSTTPKKRTRSKKTLEQSSHKVEESKSVDVESKQDIAQELENLGLTLNYDSWGILGTLLILLVSGLMIGGLIGLYQTSSYSSIAKNSNTSLQANKSSSTTLPTEIISMDDQAMLSRTGGVESSTKEFVPSVQRPMVSETTQTNLQITNAPESKPAQQEFNNGNYKVYQNPDGSLSIVW
jgi:hypothetical protein